MSCVLFFKVILVFGKIFGFNREFIFDYFVSLMRVSFRGRLACRGGKMEGRSILNLWLFIAFVFDVVFGGYIDRFFLVNKFYVFLVVLKGESFLRYFVLISLFFLEF